MRLEHLPESRVFLSYGFKDVNTGIEAARLIMTKRWKPAVIRLYDEADTKKLSEFLNLGVQGVLMVIMCGAINHWWGRNIAMFKWLIFPVPPVLTNLRSVWFTAHTSTDQIYFF